MSLDLLRQAQHKPLDSLKGHRDARHPSLSSIGQRPPRRTFSALNLMVFTSELKLLIFKISARTFLKNVSLRKELKLFETHFK